MITPFPRPPSRRAPRRPARPRALFYSHDVFGLGHIRCTLTIAAELARRRPDAALLALTGSPVTGLYEAPPNLDYVKLPATAKRGLYAGLPPDGRDGFDGLHALREAAVEATVDAFAPRLVFVDNAPAGLGRELVRTLACLRAATPPVTLVAGMADIVDGAAATTNWWRTDGVYALLEDVYDRILIYGDRHVFDPVEEYRFTPGMAAKTELCGYLTRPDALRPPDDVRRALGAGEAPLVVVTAGGGADGLRLYRAWLEALRRPELAGVVSYIVTGPLLDERAQAGLRAAAGALPGTHLVTFTPDLLSYVNAADLVVMHGGYNTTADVVGLGKRAIIVPRERPRELTLRARRFGALGLATPLEWTRAMPAALADAALAALSAPPPRGAIDFGGRERIGALLAEALGA